MKKIIVLILINFLIVTTSYAEKTSDNWNLAAEKAKNIGHLCEKEAFKNNEAETTYTSLMALDNEIKCLKQHINEEIGKGFKSEKQELIKKQIDAILSNSHNFYQSFYFNNIYCPQNCGTMGKQLSGNEQVEILADILKKLIYLNLQKAPY